MNSLPNQTVSEEKKRDEEWLKDHFDYADKLLLGQAERIEKFSAQMQKLNGETDPARYNNIIKLKGQPTSKQYVDYRWHFPKIQIVNNEYMKRPLPTYVYSMDKHIIEKRDKQRAQLLGAHIMKKEVGFMRDMGVPVMGDMKVPDTPDELKAAMDLKTNNERAFSKIVKAGIEKYNMRLSFGRTNMHIIVGMRAFSRIEILADGKVVLTVLDPRDEICEFYENDPMRERTQIHGSKTFMTPSEIVARYGNFLDKDQIQTIYDKSVTQTDLNNKYYKRDSLSNEYRHAVTHLEWKTKQETHWKVSEDKEDSQNPYRREIDSDDWIKNKRKYKGEERRGRYKIQKNQKDNIMEQVRIGEDIFIMGGYKKYCLPNKDFSYSSIGVNEYDGNSVSLIDLAEELSFFINVVMSQIRETIRKYVGSAFVYDTAKLPKGKDVADVVYDIVEDGIVQINSRATGNASQTNFDNDHGVSFITSPQLADIQQLIILKNDLKNDLEEITAINKERQGDSLASQTATAVRQNMSQSRVMTYHLNMATDLHIREVLTKWTESVRISHAFIQPLEKSGMLNELDLSMIKIDDTASFDRFGLRLADIEREMQIAETLEQVIMPLAIQREKVEVVDVLNVALSETINEKVDKLNQSMERYNKVKSSIAENEGKQQQEQIAAQGAQIKAQQEQIHQDEIDKLILQGHIDGAKASLEAKDAVVSERAKQLISENANFDEKKKQQAQQAKQPG